MVKKKALDDLDQLRGLAFGGAMAVKGTDIIGHAGQPTALTGDIGGFIGIGIAGATSKMSMDMITGKYRKKRGGYKIGEKK